MNITHLIAIATFTFLLGRQVLGDDEFEIPKVIDLTPSQNTHSWNVTLPPQFSAKLTVRIQESAFVNGMMYKVLPDSIKVNVSDNSRNVAWMKVDEGLLCTARITNSSSNDAKALVTVTCIWRAYATGFLGGGPHHAFPDIIGTVSATAVLSPSNVIWELEPATQLSFENSLIAYRAIVCDETGMPITTTQFQEVTKLNVLPAPNDWNIDEMEKLAGFITGKIKPNRFGTETKGRLRLSYNANLKSDSPEASFTLTVSRHFLRT